MTDTPQYRASEFSKMTGVTVRTLHFYDRVGLLRPRRTPAGHRLYGPADVDALRLIQVLKFVGVPLTKIKTLTRGGPDRLAEALGEQRGLLENKRAALDQAIGALADMERTLTSHRPIDRTLQRITESMQPVNPANLRKRYRYQLAGKIARVKNNLERTRQFAELCQEIEGAMDDAPSSPRAQELARRWMELGVDATGFDPFLMTEARGMFREAFDRARGFKASLRPLTNVAVARFIQKAIALRAITR
jgi:MerR family transcriptional regulator, thiopeptide resistance regulator